MFYIKTTLDGFLFLSKIAFDIYFKLYGKYYLDTLFEIIKKDHINKKNIMLSEIENLIVNEIENNLDKQIEKYTDYSEKNIIIDDFVLC